MDLAIMDLKKVLPKEHPYLQQRSVTTHDDPIGDLLDEIENWKRGMCDWDDVQLRIDKLKEEIENSSSTENS